VRSVLLAEPSLLTSLKSAAYCSLVNAGGPSARNWDGSPNANGLTCASQGVSGGLNDGGVS
jgi:hypothetical protein